MKIAFLVSCLCVLLATHAEAAPAEAKTFIHPSNAALTYEGRWDMTYPDEPRFDWSGVSVSTSFEGTTLTLMLNDHGNEYSALIDDTEHLVTTNESHGKPMPYKIEGLSAGTHSLVLTKRTEALFGIAGFKGLELDFGAQVFPTKKQAAASRIIEFIGDSLTCGYGDLGVWPCNFSAHTENVMKGWGFVVKDALNAELHLEAWSGMGMVRNYGEKTPTSLVPFPKKFIRTLANDNDSRWDFSTWQPEAVVINLGSNDYSTDPQPSIDVFVEGYVAFVDQLRGWYGSDLKIFAACGPICRDPCCEAVYAAAKKAGGKDKNVFYVYFNDILHYPAEEGCNGHPNVEGQQKMGEAALPIIRDVMQWYE